jgi:hypothetical protein
MKKNILVVITALLLFVSSPLPAAQMQTFKSGTKLRSECAPLSSQNKNTTERLFEASCLNYIKGVFDLHQTLVAREKIEPQICKPFDVDLGQMGRVIMKYIEENPQKMKITSSSLILPALREAYPCPLEPQPQQ